MTESEVLWRVTFKSVIDSWGVHSDENVNSGALISFDAVCVGSQL